MTAEDYDYWLNASPEEMKKRFVVTGYWQHVKERIKEEGRDYASAPSEENLILEKRGKQGYALVQIVPEWREGINKRTWLGGSPKEIVAYTYYFKRWFSYD